MFSVRPTGARFSRALRSVLQSVVGGGLVAAILALAPSAAFAQTDTSPQAEAAAQKFRFCIVDEDNFRIKDVKLYLSSRPGQAVPVEPLAIEGFEACGGDGQFWRFEITNSLDTPGNRALLEFRFKTEQTEADGEPAPGKPEIDSTVTLPMRLLALNKIGEPDNHIDIWIPASVPTKFGPSYLDDLERMSKPHQIQKLMHAAILYDHLEHLFGPKSDVTRRAAIIMMNAATELTADEQNSESLYDIPDFVIKTIEESLGKRSYWDRLVSRFEESRSAPIVKADRLIRELINNGQCNSARNVLTAISAYVGEDTFLLREVRVPETHLQDLGVKIDRDCSVSG